MDNTGTASSPIIEWGVACRPIVGEVEAGDFYVVKAFPNGVLVGVIDGLGHGPSAAIAARVAGATLEAFADESVVSLVTRCHERLRHNRGAAMTLASINPQDNIMNWVSVGNVEGVLLRRNTTNGPAHQYIVLRGGVVGEQLPPLHPSATPITQGDILILATDGISHSFAERLNLSDQPQRIADDILAKYGKSTDDALVLVVRYLGLT